MKKEIALILKKFDFFAVRNILLALDDGYDIVSEDNMKDTAEMVLVELLKNPNVDVVVSNGFQAYKQNDIKGYQKIGLRYVIEEFETNLSKDSDIKDVSTPSDRIKSI